MSQSLEQAASDILFGVVQIVNESTNSTHLSSELLQHLMFETGIPDNIESLSTSNSVAVAREACAWFLKNTEGLTL